MVSALAFFILMMFITLGVIEKMVEKKKKKSVSWWVIIFFLFIGAAIHEGWSIHLEMMKPPTNQYEVEFYNCQYYAPTEYRKEPNDDDFCDVEKLVLVPSAVEVITQSHDGKVRIVTKKNIFIVSGDLKDVANKINDAHMKELAYGKWAETNAKN
jgi:hypothetical protein